MRALSLWQPWATAIAVKAKRTETRDWYTDYRGPLAIHAAKRLVRSEMEMLRCSLSWRAAVNLPPNMTFWGFLPFGKVVATCTLADCILTQKVSEDFLDEPRSRELGYYPEEKWCERQMGNFAPGRFAWILENVREVKEPFDFKGKQGFFNVPEHLFEDGGLALLP